MSYNNIRSRGGADTRPRVFKETMRMVGGIPRLYRRYVRRPWTGSQIREMNGTRVAPHRRVK